MPLRLVMMGTGEFALPAFRTLYQTPHQVVGLFTQPDRTGRGHHHHVNPLKEFALSQGTPVFQPTKVNKDESLQDLRELDADLCVVAAYGQILSPKLLSIPRLGAVNLHASLLPKYRGAAPIQYAIWKGETETGVTIFQIEPSLDSGPILAVATTPIAPQETAGQLHDRLAELAVPLTVNLLDQLEDGSAVPLTQNSDEVTLAPRLSKQDGVIDWSASRRQVDCHIRAVQPWPKPTTRLVQANGHSQRMLILEVAAGPEHDGPTESSPPGTIVAVDVHHLVVRVGDGLVNVLRIQPEGKRAMTVDEFLCGHVIEPGDRFVNPRA